LNPQAEELNEIIRKNSKTVYELLSNKGKAIFFPKKGILAQTAEAKGKKINATIGAAIEDDGSPMRLHSIEKEVNIDPGKVFPYAPSFGRIDMRKKWKQMVLKKNPSLGNNISLPVVTNALTHGLSMVGYLFLDDNDSIIIPKPYWGNYNLIFANGYNANVNTFPLFKENKFNVEGFKEKLKGNRLIVLLNFPNNPTGYTITEEEAKKIISNLKEAADQGKNIAIVLDDAYFGLVYEEGIEKESLFTQLANLHENILAIKLDGCTKEDYVWGFRVGFITFGIKAGTEDLYTALESKVSGAIRGNISNAPNISQSLVLKAYESETYDEEKKEKFQLLKSRYEEVKKALKDKKYQEFFQALPFNSGYFMCIKLIDKINAEEVRQKLLGDFDTGVISMPDNLIRIAFSGVAKKDIPNLFHNIYSACGGAK